MPVNTAATVKAIFIVKIDIVAELLSQCVSCHCSAIAKWVVMCAMMQQ